MNEAIKSTMMSSGWLEIRRKLDDKMNGLRMAKNISKKKQYQDIAIEALGKAYAYRTLERWLKELDGISNTKKMEPIKRFI